MIVHRAPFSGLHSLLFGCAASVLCLLRLFSFFGLYVIAYFISGFAVRASSKVICLIWWCCSWFGHASRSYVILQLLIGLFFNRRSIWVYLKASVIIVALCEVIWKTLLETRNKTQRLKIVIPAVAISPISYLLEVSRSLFGMVHSCCAGSVLV